MSNASDRAALDEAVRKAAEQARAAADAAAAAAKQAALARAAKHR